MLFNFLFVSVLHFDSAGDAYKYTRGLYAVAGMMGEAVGAKIGPNAARAGRVVGNVAAIPVAVVFAAGESIYNFFKR